MVHPSGPSNHFWISFGSVCARYTASGGAANRLVTTTHLSPSVLSVILLIGFSFLSLGSCLQGPRRACRSFCSELPSAWKAKGRRSEEHTSELQSHLNLVCRLL